MKRLVALYQDIDNTTSTKEKTGHLAAYFRAAPPRDAVWTLYYFMGRKQKRLLKRSILQEAIQDVSGLPTWLFDECYSVVGDLAETISLLSNDKTKIAEDIPLHIWIEERIPALVAMAPEAQKETLKNWWRELSSSSIFLLVKLITGGFRSGVSERIVIRALSEAFEIPEARLAERLIGDWPATVSFFESLASDEDPGESLLPYPFFLASPTDEMPDGLGDSREFACEWKWDGIRAQIVRRSGQTAIWSRGEELISASFPELLEMAERLPDGTVIDGEILLFSGDQVRPFGDLQKRLQRKKIGEKMLKDFPASFLAFDCLQWASTDLRERPLSERRVRLESLHASLQNPTLRISTLLSGENWDELRQQREESRERAVEGLMLKRWSSPYQSGRKKGDWWKWKVEPMTLDAVLLYAQPGHGKRATLYTDYTFGIWRDKQLVPFAKAYSGLSNDEIVELDGWIRKNTLERFGPVRSVKAERVFEIAFEGIGESTRHKSGLAVRFPRILRERRDKTIAEADSLESAKELMHGHTSKSDSNAAVETF